MRGLHSLAETVKLRHHALQCEGFRHRGHRAFLFSRAGGGGGLAGGLYGEQNPQDSSDLRAMTVTVPKNAATMLPHTR